MAPGSDHLSQSSGLRILLQVPAESPGGLHVTFVVDLLLVFNFDLAVIDRDRINWDLRTTRAACLITGNDYRRERPRHVICLTAIPGGLAAVEHGFSDMFSVCACLHQFWSSLAGLHCE